MATEAKLQAFIQKQTEILREERTIPENEKELWVPHFPNSDGLCLGELEVGSQQPCVALDLEKQHLFLVRSGGLLECWDLRNQDLQKKLDLGNVGTVWGAELSPDSRYLALAYDSGCYLLETSGNWESPAPLNEREVELVSWSPTGRYIAFGAILEKLSLWDAGTKTKIGELELDLVTEMAWLRKPERLVAGTSGCELIIWEIGDKEPAVVDKPYSNDICQIKVAPDQETLIIGYADGTFLFWSIESRQVLWQFRFSTIDMRRLSWNLLGNCFVAVACGVSPLQVWNCLTGELLSQYEHPIPAHSILLWTANGAFLAAYHVDGKIRFWDTRPLLKM